MDYTAITANYNGDRQTVNVMHGESVLDALRNAGIYVPALCGGKGTCGKCKVLVKKGFFDVTDSDKQCLTQDDIEKGYRLSCVAYLRKEQEGEVEIDITSDSEENFSALTSYSGKIGVGVIEKGESSGVLKNGKEADYSIAVDIGTTTIAFALVNVANATVCGNLTVVNKQRKYGADVISRILSATGGKLTEMSELVKSQISGGISAICNENGVELGLVTNICISANTTMIHILLGLSCETLGAYPFTPVTLDHIKKDYDELFEGGLKARVHILPGISAYVGADITAGVYFTELHKSTKPSMLIDIGTNGEMAVFSNGKIYCTATAAGPAFEGGNISWGTGSVAGAVSAVTYENGAFAYETINNKPPVGICGSGVIDIVCACLENGIIDKTGRFKKTYGSAGVTIAKTAEGREINFTQKDVRELQLGKSAIRSGIDVLLAFARLTYDDIQTVYIAGGFGFKINFESGTALGLIPSEFINKLSLVGNSSLGGGVKYLLNECDGNDFVAITDICTEHNLPQDKLFTKLYIENMSF